MKNALLFLTFITTSIFSTTQSRDSIRTIAVYPSINPSPTTLNITVITDRIENRILALGRYRLLSASRLPSLTQLGNGQYEALKTCPEHIDQLCIVSLEQSENNSILTLKLIDIPTSAVIAVGQKRSDGSESQIMESVDTLVNEIILQPSSGREVIRKDDSNSIDPCGNSDAHQSDSLKTQQQGMLQWNKIALGGFALLSMMMLITFSSKQ